MYVSFAQYEEIKPQFLAMVAEWRERIPWLQGLAIGQKIMRGQWVGEDALTFFVGAKIDNDGLDAKQRIPGTLTIPGTDITLPSDVVPTAKFRFISGKVHGGDAIAPLGSGSAGSVGAVLTRKSDGKKFILSASHTIVGIGGGLPLGQKIVHPPGSADVIGTVSQTVAWNSYPPAMNADVGLVEVNVPDDVEPGLGSLGKVIDTTTPVLSGNARFAGATGIKAATVAWDQRGIHFIEDVFAFDNTFLLLGTPANSGDSGAVVVDEFNRAIGIVFATNSVLTACSAITGIDLVIDLSKYDF